MIKVMTGWKRQDLYKHFAELGFKLGAEIGVFRGRNARSMFREIPNLKLIGVEPYDDQPSSTRHKTVPRYERNERVTMERLAGRDMTIIKNFSEIAVQEVEYNSLDFVYIDGDHSYDYAMLDIILWTRRVRPGGIVAGHDYIAPEGFNHAFDVNVKEAVDDYVRIHKIDPLYLTDAANAINRSDKCPSWWFIKT